MPTSNHLDTDLNDITVFAKVVEQKSFTAAGKLLGLPRSTVSRRVAKLERGLGVRLLHRTTRSLQLTDLGAAYYERCSHSLALLTEAESILKAAQVVPRGNLRITAPNDLGNLLAPLVASFLALHPEVRIGVELTQRKVDLVEEGFDLAVRATPSLPDSTLVARRLAWDEGRIFASPGYLERRGEPHSPQDLSTHECVLFAAQGSHSTWRLMRGQEMVEVPVSGPINANDPTFCREAAVAGVGVVNLPSFLAQEAVRAGKLIPILSDYRSSESSVWLVYPSAKHLSATVRAFRDHMVAGIGELSIGSSVHPPAR